MKLLRRWLSRIPKVKIHGSDVMTGRDTHHALRVAGSERMSNTEGAYSRASVPGTDRATGQERSRIQLHSSDSSRVPRPGAR